MRQRKFATPYKPSWFILACLVSTLGLSGCAELSGLTNESNTLESAETATEVDAPQLISTPPPPPTIEEVEEAIVSTKTLLDDQQKQIGELLTLRGKSNKRYESSATKTSPQ